MNNSAILPANIDRWGRFWTALLVTFFLSLALRLVHIRLGDGQGLLEYRDRHQQRTIALPACRGSILDRRSRLLAGSEERPTVIADPSMLDLSTDGTALAAALGASPDELRRRISAREATRYCLLARRTTDEQAAAVKKMDLRGVRITDEPRRFYPHGDLLAQVLGFVGSEDQGQEGLELQFDRTLSGAAGRFSANCDNRRRLLWSIPDGIVESEDGMHLILTVDAVAQEILERELAAALNKYRATGGVGVVLDPRNGQILAMASQPGFDLNDRQAVLKAVRRNRCLTDPVEPGSVFKPFIMAAAINEGVVSPDDKIDCGDGLHFFGKRPIRDTHPNNVLTAEGVLVKSSNIGMGQIAGRLGNTKLLRYISSFGFGELTGIDLPGESRGIVVDLQHWTSYSTQSVAMGQELAVTPLQMACALGALANGGRLARPHIVQAVADPRTGQCFTRESEPLRQVIPEATARTVAQRMLRRVVEDSPHDVHSPRYSILGKTGTAQIPERDRRGYKPGAYLSSFMAAAPAADPCLVVVVMIQEPDPSIGYYGGIVAGPVVRNVLDATLAYLEVPPDKAAAARPGDARD